MTQLGGYEINVYPKKQKRIQFETFTLFGSVTDCTGEIVTGTFPSVKLKISNISYFDKVFYLE